MNPRRDDWDSSWEQKLESPNFSQQVNWELNGLERSDIIILYLSPDTKSPISLLELGLFARSGKLLVCCPNGFWRINELKILLLKLNDFFLRVHTSIKESNKCLANGMLLGLKAFAIFSFRKNIKWKTPHPTQFGKAGKK